MIPYGFHYIDEEDINAVVDVLRHGYLTQGPKVDEFEKAFAAYVGVKYAVAVSSGTAALHLASLVADFGVGDNVITSANTFVASANCIQYVGANPVFTDIEANSLNMDVNDLSKRCHDLNEVAGIIPVHFAGLSCDMVEIKRIADQYNSIIIEDASHGLGGNYEDGSKIGCCKYSDMTTFSFHPVKGIAAGEGGLITTNNELFYNKLLKLRSHGIYKGNFEFPGISIGDDKLINQENAFENGQLNPWYYEMQDLGFNYRITDIQCALALSQLKKVNLFIQRRKEIVDIYDESFTGRDYLMPAQFVSRNNSAHHIYVLRIKYSEIGKTRKVVMEELREFGVGSQVHYMPVPLHPYYEKMGFDISNYKETSRYYDEALTIPLYYSLTDKEVVKVIENTLEVISI
jgi:perosamine synthetase